MNRQTVWFLSKRCRLLNLPDNISNKKGIYSFGEYSLRFFYSAVNKLTTDKLITDKNQNIYHLISQHSGFIIYSLNKLD